MDEWMGDLMDGCFNGLKDGQKVGWMAGANFKTLTAHLGLSKASTIIFLGNTTCQQNDI